MYLRSKKKLRRIVRRLFGLRRGQYAVLRRELQSLLETVRQPVVVETGCIRDRYEGSDSTLLIASMIRDRGRFYTFELRPRHIEECRIVCGEFNAYIEYVQGDSVSNLAKLVGEGILDRVDFAFLDSANDADHIFSEFRAIENRFPPGAVLMVDDVLWAEKGKRILPYLEASDDWDVRVKNVENGILIARRL